jgi:FkbM family methyltransferase
VASNDTNSNVHIEIGANIGSCIWELLQSDQEAQVFAFEPHPRNLFALTSTLKANPEYGKRVTLFPVALGAELGTVELALEAMPNMEGRINYGGSFVFGSLAGDAAPVGTGTVVEHRVRRELVPVERLDQVLNRFSTLQHVRLAKLDAQGFECNILDGMLPRMLPYRIVTELEPRSLQRAGCSWQGMLQRLTEYYKVYRYRQSGKLDPLPRTDLNMELNAVAILRDDGRGSINNKSTS